jgi:hypothetical protein
MAINTTTGSITAGPSANGNWVVTASATDASATPVSGSLKFLVSVGSTALPTLSLTTDASSNPLIRPSTYFVPNANVATVVANGGTAPYTFAFTTPGAIPTGLTIDPASGIVSVSGVPAGVYEVSVTVTDSAGTPNTNTINFPVTIKPYMASSAGQSLTGAAGVANSALTQITATTGNPSSTITYSGVNFPAWMSVNSSTGVISTTSSAAAGTYYVGVTATDSQIPTHGNAGASATIYLVVAIQ